MILHSQRSFLILKIPTKLKVTTLCTTLCTMRKTFEYLVNMVGFDSRHFRRCLQFTTNNLHTICIKKTLHVRSIDIIVSFIAFAIIFPRRVFDRVCVCFCFVNYTFLECCFFINFYCDWWWIVFVFVLLILLEIEMPWISARLWLGLCTTAPTTSSQ